MRIMNTLLDEVLIFAVVFFIEIFLVFPLTGYYLYSIPDISIEMGIFLFLTVPFAIIAIITPFIIVGMFAFGVVMQIVYGIIQLVCCIFYKKAVYDLHPKSWTNPPTN